MNHRSSNELCPRPLAVCVLVSAWMLLVGGCASNLTLATEATRTSDHSGANNTADAVMTGVLSRRGSDMNGYWALRTQEGRTIVIVATSPALEAQLVQLQQQIVRVTGQVKPISQPGVPANSQLELASIDLN